MSDRDDTHSPLSAKDAMRSAWELLKFISVPTGIEAVGSEGSED